jgi:hypothetical protein
VVRFLSPEWIDALDDAVRSDAGLRDATAGVRLTVEQHVTDDGDGDGDGDGEVVYHLVVDDGRVAVSPGVAGNPDVTFVQDRPTAAAIGAGTATAQDAFMSGRLRVSGDVPLLIRCKDALRRLDHALAGVRNRTTY